MPNWVSTRLTLTGDEEQIAACVAAATGENDEIDFCRLRPMPRELKDTLCPPEIVSVEEYERRIQEDNPWDHPITQAMSDDLIARFGTDNWYDWQRGKWGVKWGLCELQMTGDREWVFSFNSFNTPWSPACVLWLFISDQYPLVTFTTEVCDDQLNFWGTIEYRAGTFIEEIFDDPDGPILPWNWNEEEWSEFWEFDRDADQGENEKVDWEDEGF
jgi:hypothetical protein